MTIKSDYRTILNEFNQQFTNKLLLGSTVVGSCLYGIDNENSDIDVIFTFVSSLGGSLLGNRKEVLRYNLPDMKDELVGHNILEIINQIIFGNFSRLPLFFDQSEHPNKNVSNCFYTASTFSKTIIKNRHLLFSDLLYEKCLKQSNALFHEFEKTNNPKSATTAIRNFMSLLTIEYDSKNVDMKFFLNEEQRNILISIREGRCNHIDKIFNHYKEELENHRKLVKMPKKCNVKDVENLVATLFL